MHSGKKWLAHRRHVSKRFSQIFHIHLFVLNAIIIIQSVHMIWKREKTTQTKALCGFLNVMWFQGIWFEVTDSKLQKPTNEKRLFCIFQNNINHCKDNNTMLMMMLMSCIYWGEELSTCPACKIFSICSLLWTALCTALPVTSYPICCCIMFQIYGFSGRMADLQRERQTKGFGWR